MLLHTQDAPADPADGTILSAVTAEERNLEADALNEQNETAEVCYG